MPVSQEYLEGRTKASKHACKFLGCLIRLESTAMEELRFACESTGISTGGRAHSSPLFAVWTRVADTCVPFFTRKLGCVLDRQPTMILRVSAVKR